MANDIVFRYSAIDTSMKCLRRYQLQYVQQVKVDGLDSGDTMFGTAIHSALEAILEGEDGIDVFNMFWGSLEDRELQYGQFGWDRLRDIGNVLLQRFIRLHAKNFKPVSMEQKMRGKIGPYDFEGTADFIGLYKGVPSILDFKTSGRAYTKEKIITNHQMPIYAELAKQTLKYEAKQAVYIVLIKSEMRIQVQTIELTEEFVKKHLQNVEEQCKILSMEHGFPMNPGSCMFGSYRCPYYQICHGEDK